MTRYRLFYHFVWSTKDRLPLLQDPIREAVLRSIATKVEELRGTVHALNAMGDHVHLVATVPPTVALTQFIAQVKGFSSHLAARLLAESGGAFAWQAEYGVISVSESHMALVVNYVRDQQRHHANNTLNQTLETTTSLPTPHSPPPGQPTRRLSRL